MAGKKKQLTLHVIARFLRPQVLMSFTQTLELLNPDMGLAEVTPFAVRQCCLASTNLSNIRISATQFSSGPENLL